MQTVVACAPRITTVWSADAAVGERVHDLVDLATTGLRRMYHPDNATFPRTVRRDGSTPLGLRPEGVSPRYAAMAALGLSRLGGDAQRAVLAGGTATELAHGLDDAELPAADLGTAAVAVWAAAEITGAAAVSRVRRLENALTAAATLEITELAWTLTALVAAGRTAGASRAAERLLAAQGVSGLFPKRDGVRGAHAARARIGCFADQVYPVQALARFAAATGDGVALAAADRCAARIVGLQGPAGQWWWHYDARRGDVVEGYPVYSVHQHAMAPMALFDLSAAGGADHLDAVLAGLEWLARPPESGDELVDRARSVVWRKVGRREPRRLVRSVRAAVRTATPLAGPAWLDRAFPPGPVDFECRPYELGWLLYAWLADATPAAGCTR